MPTIGFLIDWVASQYHQQMWESVSIACRNKGFNLVTFVIGKPGSDFRWKYIEEQLQEFISCQRMDGFIILCATIANHLPIDKLKNLIDKAKPAPVVSIGLEIEGIPSIISNCDPGFSDLLEHLHMDHGYKKFAYIAGPDYNPDTQKRNDIFFSFIRRHGLPLPAERLYIGNYNTSGGRDGVTSLLAGNNIDFDVLVCANDNMAIGALEELTRRGFDVPGDVALCGYDNSKRSDSIGLSTVHQPITGICTLAVEKMADILSGKKAGGIERIPSRAVIRQSCGCLPGSARYDIHDIDQTSSLAFSDRINKEKDIFFAEMAKSGLPDYILVMLTTSFMDSVAQGNSSGICKKLRLLQNSTVYEDCNPNLYHEPLSVLRKWYLSSAETDRNRLIAENCVHAARIQLTHNLLAFTDRQEAYRASIHDLLIDFGELLIHTKHEDEQKKIIKKTFKDLCINKYWYSLFDRDIEQSDEARLIISGTEDTGKTDVVYKRIDLLPDAYMPTNEPWSLIGEAIFDNEGALGFFLMDPSDQNILLSVFDQIGERLGRGLSVLNRIRDLEYQVARRTEELNEVLLDLEEYNKQLKELALKDELTGLYNRRGFITLADHMIKSQLRHNAALALFYGDLDGLKKVNDTWGHDVGDMAIRSTAELFEKEFRAEDITARIGGDEFIALAPKCGEEEARTLADRLEQALYKKANKRFGISLGWVIIHPGEKNSLETWMKLADQALYKAKRAKKKQKGLYIYKK